MYAHIAKNINEYILNFPPDIQLLLEKLRACIRKSAPTASEKTSYGIPTFFLHGNLVHFAAYKNHVGFYPGSAAIQIFKNDLLKYKTSKGTVQFPIDQPIPYPLITKIVKFRVKENLEKASNKTKLKK